MMWASDTLARFTSSGLKMALTNGPNDGTRLHVSLEWTREDGDGNSIPCQMATSVQLEDVKAFLEHVVDRGRGVIPYDAPVGRFGDKG